MNRQLRFLLAFAFISSGLDAIAASCCGSGQGSGSVITGDERYRFRYMQTVRRSSGRSIEFGQAVQADDPSKLLGGSAGVSHVLSDLWQVSASTGWTQTEDAAVGLRDSQILSSYMLRRNYLYSSWAPEIFLSAGAVLPTGTSFYANRDWATDDDLLKARLAVLFSKLYVTWDWSLAIGYGRAFSKYFQSSKLSFEKGDAWSGELSFGYSPSFMSALHLTLSQTAEYAASNRVTRDGQQLQRSLSSYLFPVSLSAAYAVSESFAVALAWQSSKIFKSQNADLFSTATLSLSYRLL